MNYTLYVTTKEVSWTWNQLIWKVLINIENLWPSVFARINVKLNGLLNMVLIGFFICTSHWIWPIWKVHQICLSEFWFQFLIFGRLFQGIWWIGIKILMKRFCSVPLHISLWTNLRVSHSKYGYQRTNSTFGSNSYQVEWKFKHLTFEAFYREKGQYMKNLMMQFFRVLIHVCSSLRASQLRIRPRPCPISAVRALVIIIISWFIVQIFKFLT